MSKKSMRQRFIVLSLIIAGFSLTACAKEKDAVYRISILTSLPHFQPVAENFKQELSLLGYNEGQNVIYDHRHTDSEIVSEQEEIMRDFIGKESDLIIVAPTGAALVAKDLAAAVGIPVIFASAYTNNNGLIDSVREPGGNITGIRWQSSAEFVVLHLKILHEIIPSARRIWIAYKEDYSTVPEQLQELRKAALEFGLELVEVPAEDFLIIRADLQARDKLADPGIDAILIISEPITNNQENYAEINNFAVKRKLLVSGPPGPATVFAYGPEVSWAGRQSAHLADKILKGASAGTIPVITAEPELKIYQAIAEQLGIQLTESLIGQASQIIR